MRLNVYTYNCTSCRLLPEWILPGMRTSNFRLYFCRSADSHGLADDIHLRLKDLQQTIKPITIVIRFNDKILPKYLQSVIKTCTRSTLLYLESVLVKHLGTGTSQKRLRHRCFGSLREHIHLISYYKTVATF